MRYLNLENIRMTTNIDIIENMIYLEEKDAYSCKNDKELNSVFINMSRAKQDM